MKAVQGKDVVKNADSEKEAPCKEEHLAVDLVNGDDIRLL